MELKVIARIYTDFPEKFGLPRQSGIIEELKGKIIFEPEYRDINAVREINSYTFLWLIWGFSLNGNGGWNATVRPPRLGGNKRVGVFASRSPFRPNPIGLSSVKLEGVDLSGSLAPVIYVSGIDMADKTPVYDIKPYLPYVDIHETASDGFALNTKEGSLNVYFPDNLLETIPKEKRSGLISVLEQDPRPQYQYSSERVYYLKYCGYEIEFTVNEIGLYVRSVNEE